MSGKKRGASQRAAAKKGTPKKRAAKRGTAKEGAAKKGAAKKDEAEVRADRIIDVAVQLAEEGGFENVRQRDVARLAGVALGTLYKSFRSKEDILAAALQRETDQLERKLERKPAMGATAAERLGNLFSTMTRALLRKPNYARALLKAMTSGEEVAAKVAGHQIKVTRMVIAAARGPNAPPMEETPPTHDEIQVAMVLQQLWFAALVGWSAKLHGHARVVEQIREAAELLVLGIEARRDAGAPKKRTASKRKRA